MKNVSTGEQVRLFNMLSLETNALCNRSCVFCPNHKHERPDEFMDDAIIDKVISELSGIGWRGSMNTFMYNEPTRDPRLLEIARKVSNLTKATFMVSTNGDYLRGPESLSALFDSGVRMVHVNIYSEWDLDEVKRDRGITAARRRYEQIDGWISELGLERTRSIYGTAPRGARRIFLEAKFGASPTDTKIGEKFEIQNRSGNIGWMMPALREPMSKMCVRPFRNMNVNWRGDVLLCCNDYRGSLSFGNLRDVTLVDAWNSEKMNIYRLYLQNKRRDTPLCSTCDYSGGHYQHNIDKITFGQERDEAILSSRGHTVVRSLK